MSRGKAGGGGEKVGEEKADPLQRSLVFTYMSPPHRMHLPEQLQGCYFKSYVEKYSHCCVNYNSKLNKCTCSSAAVAISTSV